MDLDLATKGIIAANILAIILAIALGWDFSTIIWMYWFESVIIGFYTFLGLFFKALLSGKEIRKKLGIAFFFPVHYGGFHLGYLVFLAFLVPPTEFGAILLGSVVFLLSHGFSFIRSLGEKFDPEKEFMMPYLRIVPMHLTILFGGILMAVGVHVLVMVFFMGLKTAADVVAHQVKHKKWHVKQLGKA